MPPKAATNTPESTTRTRIAGRTGTSTPNTLTRDEADSITAPISDVHTERDAKKWMTEGLYLMEGESITAMKLAHVMLQIAAAIPKLTKQGVNAMRAAALLLETLSVEQEGRVIGEAVGAHTEKFLREHILPMMDKVKETTAEIAKTGETMVTATETITNMAAQVQNTNSGTGDNTHLGIAVDNVLARTEHVVQMLQEEKESRTNDRTYAAAVSALPSLNYEQSALVARGNLQDRQVVIRKAPGAEGDQLATLTERELVEKATVALELMGIAAADRPEGMKFLGARRTQTGAVIYTLDATASANYMRRNDVMKSFMDHFGGTSALHVRAHQVVVEHVPVTFDETSLEARRRVEGASRLPPGSIYEVRWIKPIHLREATQRVAFLIVGFASREAANKAMDYGIMIEGKHCKARKLLPEPKRCVKCQGYGHFARDCKSEKDVCARCAGEHRTADPTCQAMREKPMRCANCLKDGHGAADRGCEIYRNKLAQIRARDPDSRFRLFPTNDPNTWARVGDPAPMDRFDDAWKRDHPPHQTPPTFRQALSQRGRPGVGPRFGNRGGYARGGVRVAQTGATRGGAAWDGTEQPPGSLRQRTLAETWTVNGGRMGAFGTQTAGATRHTRETEASVPSVPSNPNDNGSDNNTTASANPTQTQNEDQHPPPTQTTITNTNTTTPTTPPAANGATTCSSRGARGETIDVAAKHERITTCASEHAGNGGEEL